ncbi:division/cell wall cluster transcriptional repressor MraZ [Laribacter hongkongensis]|uniref:division/cell wall cluster transcriptional repressor MraZ n=1 Tax=Laribacter hongkongensis TaxID=168471 RepID=UPI001EFC7CE6|nr:division/cell wall cluster transcriptional repressor MraZ [Laribacter hongkongensis]MCG8995245.1 division/cell wall cluster transcriptional repressor MraZ [Laribacter hongkongensis]MCG9011422.1 division/cell wall cluster transcriptional repressor MraZ [Laribacter hongkongensis]MCG9022995.1 division/cell wall cluster transcriptional repressor MraZ [Laribacter hongkongensis]MCG9048258.1 division/cell wall cluster transcriptional repressor MraZ [Laribacter hongkongensis]MCG9074663.1 division/c
MLNGGVASLTLDGKGRLMVPVRLRADMSDATLVVTLESAKCLLLYPLSCWQPVEARLMSLPANDPAALRFQRLVLGHAEALTPDPAGRILLPARLRKLAGLERKVVLVGMGRRWELWDEARWDAEMDAVLAAPDSLAHLGEIAL